MHGLEQKWGAQIRFVYLDVDDARTTPFKQLLGYQYQPHFFLLDGKGQVLGQWVGRVNPADLEAAFQEALQ